MSLDIVTTSICASTLRSRLAENTPSGPWRTSPADHGEMTGCSLTFARFIATALRPERLRLLLGPLICFPENHIKQSDPCKINSRFHKLLLKFSQRIRVPSHIFPDSLGDFDHPVYPRLLRP